MNAAGGPGVAAHEEPADLRLLAPAAAVWGSAAITVGAAPSLAFGCAAVLLAVSAVAAATRRRGSRIAAAALICAAAAVAASGARTHARDVGPLPQLAERGARVSADVVLTSDPSVGAGRVIGARRLGGSVFVRARVERIDTGGISWQLRHPVIVFGSGDWSERLPGDRLRITAKVGAAEPGGDVAAILSANGPPLVLARTSSVGRIAGSLRAGLREAVSGLPPKTAGLLPGLVDGDTGGLDPALKEDFQRTGMSHLTAVSGSNVAFILAAALLLARRVRLGPRAAAVVAAVALAMFVVLVRPSPSVLRAAFMGSIGLFATVTGRERRALSSLFTAILVLVLFDPLLSRSLGFALSTFATLGLLVLAPELRTRLARRLPGWLADVVAVPLAAQLACTPLLAAATGAVSISSVPANVLAMPAVGLATVGGVITAFAAPVSMPVARIAAWFAGVPTGWLVRVAESFARLPASTLPWSAGWAGAVTAVLAIGFLGFAAGRPTLRRAVGTAVLTSLLAVVGVRWVAPSWPPPNWAVVVCDIGQGDAIVVRGGGSVLVVDAGPDPQAVDSCLRDLGVRSIAALVLTHMHADHVEGIPGVLRGRQLGLAQVGPLDEPADEAARAYAWLAAGGVPVARIALGETHSLGAMSYTVLGPAVAFRGTESDPNNSSLVLSVQMPGLGVLLTGDAEDPAQLTLLRDAPALRADVLKVPHHGSRKMIAAFSAATGAQVAVTSVGRGNPYGHPAAITMTTLARDGMRGYRTDRDGDVAIAPARGDTPVVVTARSGSGTPPVRAAPQWTRVAAFAGGRQLWCPVRAPPARHPTGASSDPSARREILRPWLHLPG